jgi:type IV pilus assembly protein PilN
MIRINLIRGKRKKRRELNLGAFYFMIPVIVAACLFLLHRNVTERVEGLRASINKATAEVARLKKEIGEVDKFKARKAELQRKVDIISSLQNGRLGPVKVFGAVTEAIPEKCWVDSLALKGDKVTLSGIAVNNNVIAGFMTGLTKTGRFSNVVLGSADQTQYGGYKMVKFSLTFQAVN